MTRNPDERIDELLQANEDYRQRALAAEALVKTERTRVVFWQAQCERHAEAKAMSDEEVERLRVKIASTSPNLFNRI